MLEAVLRAIGIYVFLIVCFRLSGRRTIGQATTFDMMIMLIISEAVSPALTQEKHSLAQAGVLVLALLGLNFVIALVKCRSEAADRVIDGVPIVLFSDGQLHTQVMRRMHVDLEDLLEAARQEQGLTSLDDVRLAILERSGQISIVPKANVR